MTAVEWLVEEFEVISNSTEISKIEKIELYNKAIEQAKEMAKEQIIDAWNNGQSDGATICTQKADNQSEEYYKETFKSE